jgi:Short C-terminal domain
MRVLLILAWTLMPRNWTFPPRRTLLLLWQARHPYGKTAGALATPGTGRYGHGNVPETETSVASGDSPLDEAPGASSEPSNAIPAMPSAPESDLYSGATYLLADDAALRHSVGWHEDRKAGRGFIVARKRSTGRATIIERFPLTEEGWAAAWQALSDLDESAAATVAAILAKRAARERAAAARRALDAESLYVVRYAVFNGGSGPAALTKGQGYDLRFLRDRIVLCPPRSEKAIVELPYRDVESVEVSGSSPSGSSGELVVICFFLGLLGAVIGLLIHRLIGLLLGALIFGLIGALIGVSMTKTDTIVYIRATDADLYLLHHQKRPDALRMELSEPLRAIRSARTRRPDAPGERGAEPESVPDQLSKLGSLLQQGLITREEFEQLKARLIASP